MNKKLTLGIGVCALAFGAVAAVISTRAIETKADDPYVEYVKVHYTADGTWGDGKADIALTKDGDNYVLDKLTLGAGGKFCLYYKWSDGSDTWVHLYETGDMPTGWWPAANNGKREKGDPWNGAGAGDYSITVSDFGWDSSASDSYAHIAVALADTPEPEPFVIESWGLVGSENGWAETAGSTFTHDTVKGVYTLEYDATVDEEFKIRANGKWASEGSVELWWQLCDKFNQDSKLHKGSSNAQFKVAKTFIFTIKDTLTPEIAGDYMQVGDYIDVSIKGELADGYYVIGLGDDWTTASAIGSETLTDGNKFQKTGIAMTHGDEFKIVAIKDNAIDWDDKFVALPAKTELGNDQSANFALINDKNGGYSMKVVGGGAFDIYVNSESTIYIFGTKTSRDTATEVDQFIDDFITPFVTLPDGKGDYAEWESCSDKFNTAKRALESLSENAQTLFLTDLGASEKILAARASYIWWRDHKDNAGAKVIAPLSTKSTAIIAISSVIAIGAILAGSMIYFSRKKKQN